MKVFSVKKSQLVFLAEIIKAVKGKPHPHGGRPGQVGGSRPGFGTQREMRGELRHRQAEHRAIHGGLGAELDRIMREVNPDLVREKQKPTKQVYHHPDESRELARRATEKWAEKYGQEDRECAACGHSLKAHLDPMNATCRECRGTKEPCVTFTYGKAMKRVPPHVRGGKPVQGYQQSYKEKPQDVVVHPGCRIKVIDDSVSPPRWKTIAECPDAPNPIQRVLKEHKLSGAWVFDALGEKRYVDAEVKKADFEGYLAVSPRMTASERYVNHERVRDLNKIADKRRAQSDREAKESLRNRQPQAPWSEQNEMDENAKAQYYGEHIDQSVHSSGPIKKAVKRVPPHTRRGKPVVGYQAQYKEGAKTESVLWGVKQGDEDWQEVILSTKPENFDRVKQLAAKDGYGKFRVSVIDLTQKPDFLGAIKK